MKAFWEFKFVPIVNYDLPNNVPSFSGVGLKFVKYMRVVYSFCCYDYFI